MELSQKKENLKSPWYKTWWGITILVLLFPFLWWAELLYFGYIYLKGKGLKVFNKYLIIGITIFLVTSCSGWWVYSSKAVAEIDAAIADGDFAEAKALVEKHSSIELTSVKKELSKLEPEFSNLVFKKLIEQEVTNYEKVISSATYSEIGSINKEVKKTLLDKIGEVDKIKEQIRLDKEAEIERQIQLAKEKEMREVELAKENRIKKIEEQFSAWDGSHLALTEFIKASMHDPSSYEHVSTYYWIFDDYITVKTTYRGNNLFGGKVINSIKVKALDNGKIIEVLEN